MQFIQNIIQEYKNLIGLNDLSSSTILSLLIIVVILFIFKNIRNFYLISLLTLFGTFMHELAHLIASFVTYGKPKSFTIIPKKTATGITLGSVGSANIKWYNAILISLAPLSLYGIAYYLLEILPSLSNDILYYFTLYFIANLIFAGTPSKTDWILAFKKSWFLLLIIFSLLIDYNYFHYINYSF